MILVHCAGHGTEVLLSASDYVLQNTDVGIVVAWTCPCGTEGGFVTGRRARVEHAA